MGPVRARLEPAGARVPAAARVPGVDLGDAGGPGDGDGGDVPAVGVRARAGDVLHLPQAARLPARDADVPAAPRPPQPHPLAPRPQDPRQHDLLARHLHRPQPALQPIPDPLID